MLKVELVFCVALVKKDSVPYLGSESARGAPNPKLGSGVFICRYVSCLLVLTKLELTVDSGIMNGLIFYANLVPCAIDTLPSQLVLWKKCH